MTKNILSSKIMIIGRPGSGKSTFAIWLSEKLNIKVFHLDKYFFEDNWIERNYQEFLEAQKEKLTKKAGLLMEMQLNLLKCDMQVLIFVFISIFLVGYVTGEFLKDYFIKIPVLMIEHQIAPKKFDGLY